MLDNSVILYANLNELAQHQPQDNSGKNQSVKRFKWHLPPEVVSPDVLSMFIIPLQCYLTMNQNALLQFVSGQDATTTNTTTTNNNYGCSTGPSESLEYIHTIAEQVDVASSKARPKTITIITTSGRYIRFLCKQEKNGDLRKDARMMDFNHVVNRLLSTDAQSRTRQLCLKTFSVICLNEECGLLEWVNNTNCIRHLINSAHQILLDTPSHSALGLDYTVCDYDIPSPGVSTTTTTTTTTTNNNSNNSNNNTPSKGRISAYSKYNANIPSMSKDFYQTYITKQAKYDTDIPDPMQWLEARMLFTSSSAVWSVVGYIVGLGDRHTENILLDVTTGTICVYM